jgi:hypothetical protein
MDGVTVGSEADFATNERFKGTQQRVVSGFPCPPDTLRGLTSVDITRTIGPVPVASVNAGSTDKTIKAGTYRFCGGNGFNEYPDLDHVACLSIVAGGGESRGNDHAVLVFMKEEAVAHREPPRVSMRATMAIRRMKPKAASGPWKRGEMLFIGSAG